MNILTIIACVIAFCGGCVFAFGIYHIYKIQFGGAEQVKGKALFSTPVNNGSDPLKSFRKEGKTLATVIYYETSYDVATPMGTVLWTDTELTKTPIDKGFEKEFFVLSNNKIINKSTVITCVKYGALLIACGVLLVFSNFV